MPDGLGNQSQVRTIAEQLFTVWEEKQGKRRASIPAWVSLALTIMGIAYVAGSLVGQVAEANTRSIENRQKIEALERQNSSIEQGVASLNAKMDILMEERKR